MSDYCMKASAHNVYLSLNKIWVSSIKPRQHFPVWLARNVLFCIAVAGVAQANNDGIDPSVTIEKAIQTYVVNADGTFQATFDTVELINEERAIKTRAQRPISYNKTLATLEIVEAYTQKPDGRKVIVSPDQIKEQQEPRSVNAPLFQDTVVKVVIYPEVAVGDRLVLQYKRNRTTPLFSGQFEDLSAPDFHPIKQFTRIYDLPDNLPLYADTRGFTASMPTAEAGRKVYRWDYEPSDRARIEKGAISYLDYGQYLAVSTFKDFGALAKAYDERAEDKAAVTAKVEELAKTITAGLTEPRAKALALSEWVRKNIRYVAVYIGPGGVVPHAVDNILDNRYGDCKDHVVVLQSLLSAAGIESTPALINLGNAYALQKVPTLGVLNHVITYIPSLELYLDSTAGSIAAGYLPIQALDKTVLLTKTGEIAHTPLSQHGKVENVTEIKVAANGTADFKQSSASTGWYAEWNRYYLRNTKPADRDLSVQRLLVAFKLQGSGVLDAGDLLSVENRHELKIAGRTENLVNLPGPIGVPSITSVASGIGASVAALAVEKERTQGFVCLATEIDEQSRFEFPKEISIVAIPKPVSINDENFDYTAEYSREADTIVLHRHFKPLRVGAVCSPDEYKAMRPTLEAILRDQGSQIIVQAL